MHASADHATLWKHLMMVPREEFAVCNSDQGPKYRDGSRYHSLVLHRWKPCLAVWMKQRRPSGGTKRWALSTYPSCQALSRSSLSNDQVRVKDAEPNYGQNGDECKQKCWNTQQAKSQQVYEAFLDKLFYTMFKHVDAVKNCTYEDNQAKKAC